METYCSKVCSCGEDLDAAIAAGLKAKETLDKMGAVVKTVNGVAPDGDGNVQVVSDGNVSDEQIRAVVNEYMEENPVGGSGGSLPLPETATVGQYIVVAAVDSTGKVTATQAVTLADAEEVGF